MNSKKIIYLNNAAGTYPKPEAVYKTLCDHVRTVPCQADRTGFQDMQSDPDIIDQCRKNVANLFHAPDPRDIVFTSGATEALNLAIAGLPLAGKHVITTNTEHNSVLRPLYRMQKQGTLEWSMVQCDEQGCIDPKNVEPLIQPHTKALVVNHCSNVTGIPVDLKAISDIAHEAGAWFIVDASQSAGALPINVLEDRIDLLAFTGHKSLYGIPGIGGLYIRPGLNLKPLKVGGTGIRSDLLDQPGDRPILYEAGTPNSPGIAALNAGIRFIQETGMDKMEEVKHRHIQRMYEELSGLDGIRFFGPHPAKRKRSILCFNIDGVSPADVGYMLEYSFQIVVRSGLHCAPLIHQALGSYPEGSVRISPSFFTTTQEIDSFIDAVRLCCTTECAA